MQTWWMYNSSMYWNHDSLFTCVWGCYSAGLHVHGATFPYLVFAKVSIWPPCLNLPSSHMPPHRHCQSSVLLIMCTMHLSYPKKKENRSFPPVDETARISHARDTMQDLRTEHQTMQCTSWNIKWTYCIHTNLILQRDSQWFSLAWGGNNFQAVTKPRVWSPSTVSLHTDPSFCLCTVWTQHGIRKLFLVGM